MHRFPYRDEGNPPLPGPTLDVHLRYGQNGDWTTRALVDTDSPLTVFDYGTAEALGVRIGNTGGNSWTAQVAFIKQVDFPMPFQGILGQQGFLDRHVVCFNYYAGHFDVSLAG